MPHLIIEYSANVETKIDLSALLDRLHQEAIGSGIFPIGGIRIRAYRAEHHRIADCHPENGFVHVTAIVGAGRPLDRRQEVAQHLFDVVCEELAAVQETSPLAISFNMREFDAVLNFKKNNLHEYVRHRTKNGASAGSRRD